MKVDITLAALTSDQKVVLDGQDVSSGFNEVTVHMTVGELPTVQLKAPVWETGWTGGEANVELHPETRDALIHLGWSPPEVVGYSRINLGPDDVLVVRAKGKISPDQAHHMAQVVSSVFAGHRVLVIDDSIESISVEDEGHIIQVDSGEWIIRHPFSCRPNLFDCHFNEAAVGLAVMTTQSGRYKCHIDGDGNLVLGDAVEVKNDGV